jgi:hypothetical protein
MRLLIGDMLSIVCEVSNPNSFKPYFIETHFFRNPISSLLALVAIHTILIILAMPEFELKTWWKLLSIHYR